MSFQSLLTCFCLSFFGLIAHTQVSFYWEPLILHNYETLAEAQNDPELFNLSSYGNGAT